MPPETHLIPTKPPVDGQPLWDIVAGTLGYPAFFVAHELGLFNLLADKPLTVDELADLLGTAHRPTETILLANLSLGMINRNDDKYSLTAIAEYYLLKDSPTYFGGLLNLVIENKFAVSIESLKQAVLSNKPQTYGGEDVFASHQEMIKQAHSFTRGMHSLSMAPAMVWPELIDLSACKFFLDIGGASAAHSIGVLNYWPHIKATIFEIPPVCEVAKEYISNYHLEDSITTQVGDFWNDPYPIADVHFYSQIYHDWPEEKCRFLTQKSFDSLPSGGKIILHEILYDEEKDGPFIAAASSVAMLLWTEGTQYSGKELTNMLSDSGFVDIEIKSTVSYWSIVIGVKI